MAVLSWIEDAKPPSLYLTGASGTGKSSLLEAHCLPELRQRGWSAITVRSFADPAAELVGALKVPGSIWDRSPSESDVYALLRRAADRLAKSGKRLLIILDQFEEFLILHDERAQRPFAALLRRLMQEPVENVRFLVVLRQEYEKLIDDLDLPRLRQGENWTAVGAFTARAAATFLKASGLELDERLLDRMLKGAARIDETGGLFRPITLNMLGVVLTHHTAQLPADFDAERAIQGYLRHSVTAPTVRDDAPRVLRQMITDAGTKRPMIEGELQRVTGLPLGNIRHTLLMLGADGLVRPLGREQAVWEVAHDFLARVLGQLLGRLRVPRWRRALAYATPILAGVWLLTAAGLTALVLEREATTAMQKLTARALPSRIMVAK